MDNQSVCMACIEIPGLTLPEGVGLDRALRCTKCGKILAYSTDKDLVISASNSAQQPIDPPLVFGGTTVVGMTNFPSPKPKEEQRQENLERNVRSDILIALR